MQFSSYTIHAITLLVVMLHYSGCRFWSPFANARGNKTQKSDLPNVEASRCSLTGACLLSTSVYWRPAADCQDWLGVLLSRPVWPWVEHWRHTLIIGHIVRNRFLLCGVATCPREMTRVLLRQFDDEMERDYVTGKRWLVRWWSSFAYCNVAPISGPN